MQRGLLNGSNTAVTSENFAQCWSLDPASNWHGFREAATGGSATLVQSRTANKVNEISGITNSVGSAWITPAYDAAGNTTTTPQPADPTRSYTATYDAWNRLVKLADTSSTNTAQQNAYDARMFRINRQSYSNGALSENRHFYYSSGWQSIEERIGGAPNSEDPERQQVWGGRYVDDLVLRDRDTTGGGSLNERLFMLQDANWNVVGAVDTSATVRERYFYSSFGMQTFLNAAMSNTSSTSAIENEVLFTGQRFDPVSGLLLFRNRYFNSSSGGFITRDPVSSPDGPNQYAGWFVPRFVDPMGTCVDVTPGTPTAPTPSRSKGGTIYTATTNRALLAETLYYFYASNFLFGNPLLFWKFIRLLPSSEDWLILTGSVVDSISQLPGSVAEEDTLRRLVSGDFTRFAEHLKCGETACFKRSGVSDLQNPTAQNLSVDIGIALGSYYLYYTAYCSVGPAIDVGNGNCQAKLSCDFVWKLYD
eukprot:TRINITY_DN1143_c1_g1_i14.p1 TRINITY_DN1143_c1_g1~~TRINITY_DN1143_c1_g1_i14.p1  ORF type:complete len:478 (+),score=34.16 TRINITY_DN1143_c1_g1_i14:679-2112(+)